MKSILYIVAVSSCMFIASCGNKSKEHKMEEVLYSTEVNANNGPQRMSDAQTEQDIVWKGKSYHIDINRMACDSLPKVKDDAGDLYVDNAIRLSIRRGDGTHVFSKTFVKRSFASVLDENFMSKAILEGMAFDKATDEGLVFAASVSYPQTDSFVPVVITVSSTGAVSLRKELSLDEYEGDNIE